MSSNKWFNWLFSELKVIIYCNTLNQIINVANIFLNITNRWNVNCGEYYEILLNIYEHTWVIKREFDINTLNFKRL